MLIIIKKPGCKKTAGEKDNKQKLHYVKHCLFPLGVCYFSFHSANNILFNINVLSILFAITKQHIITFIPSCKDMNPENSFIIELYHPCQAMSLT